MNAGVFRCEVSEEEASYLVKLLDTFPSSTHLPLLTVTELPS